MTQRRCLDLDLRPWIPYKVEGTAQIVFDDLPTFSLANGLMSRSPSVP